MYEAKRIIILQCFLVNSLTNWGFELRDLQYNAYSLLQGYLTFAMFSIDFF